MFWIQMSIATIALVLILLGIWHEEKLIAFEDKMYEYICDRIGYCIAKVIIAFRRLTK